MALSAGVMSVTLTFAQGLKDKDWFGRQDPYAIVRCGGQHFRTRTHVDGGKNPVWNETFSFNIINENSLEVTVMDADVGPDDFIGSAVVSLARAREQGADSVQAPVVCKHTRKHHGFVAMNLRWMPNDALRPGAAQQHQHAAYYQPAASYSTAFYAANGYAPPAPSYAYAAPGPSYAAPPPAAYAYPYAAASAAPAAAYPVYPQQYPPPAAGYCAPPAYYYGQPQPSYYR